MSDEDKSKAQLIQELHALRQRVAELEASEAKSVRAEAQRDAALEALEKAYQELEGKVEGQAAELARANEELRAEIAERLRTEETLKKSEECLRHITHNMLDIVSLVDAQGMVQYVNPSHKSILGHEPEAVLGSPFLDRIHPDDIQPLMLVIREALETGKSGKVELRARHADGHYVWLEGTGTAIYDDAGQLTGAIFNGRNITKRVRMEKDLQQRNRHLELLNRAGQVFNSSLELDDVLITVLKEVRQMLDVSTSSVWLIDPETEELVCRQTTNPQSQIARGWRLAPGQGIAGWVIQHGKSLIIPDTQADERYFRGLHQQTGLEVRSALIVPLQVKERVIGVISVVDEMVGRFDTTDLILVEALASAAAIAIENARLYEQTRQDAETKTRLLREVNHRVRNNLAAILGLLSAEQDHIQEVDRPAYQSILEDLSNRVKGLATVHRMLSESQWAPLPLSELASRLIHSSLQMLRLHQYISVDVPPSPVRVTADQAHNLALVINELATNSVKYALAGRDMARIAVRIALEGDGDTVQFEFRDDGQGYPDEVLRMERYNVGLELVQNIVCHALQGELSLRNDPGATTLVRFKVNG